MKIIPALTGPMSGKLGGMVASRNRGGQYFRRKAVPVNPDSNRQSAVRSNFATLISYWNNTLTPAERDSWSQWAANTPRIDSLGQTHVLTGQNAFVGCNSLQLLAGLPIIDENTGAYNRGESIVSTDGAFVNIPPVGIDLGVYYAASASANGNTMVFFGLPQNKSVNFYKGPYRYVDIKPITQGTPYSLSPIDDVDWPFVIPENVRLPVRLVNVFADGRYTDGFNGLIDLGVVPPP